MNPVTSYEYKPQRLKVLTLLDSIFSQWQYKLRVFLSGLILAQYIVWFSSYWLSATTWLVSAVLVITCVIEMFPRFHWVIRMSVQGMLILYVHIVALDMTWTPMKSMMLGGRLGRFGDFLSGLGHYLIQLSPYIVYSLIAWMIYHAMIAYLSERARIIMVVVCSVILFAVVDSYSQFIFWEQVAYIIFSGLGLIVIEHFEHFRLKHPVSWSYFSDYPFVIATPIILIIAVIMLMGSLAPNARPLLTDPYTAYMHLKGEKVITSGKNLSSGSNRSLLNTSSGYGRDDSAIGGGFDYDFAEVLSIETDQRSYLRGETKSLYTGKGWELSDRDLEATFVKAAYQTELDSFQWGTAPTYDTIEVEQIIRLTNDKQYPVLFGAYPISSIENVQMNQGLGVKGLLSDAIWSASQGELRWDSNVDYPLMYTLHSKLPLLDEAALREGDALTTEYDGEQWEPYLQLPDNIPDRVRELASEISNTATAPYDKVKLIEQYLRTNYEYTNRPDVSLANSDDFVDSFLFDIKTGYCDYFSTAMAVMVRTLGLPSRWVKGYTGGSLDVGEEFIGTTIPNEIASVLGGIQTYIVKNSDAHSWVEVYFEGWGWIAFEPTSGFVLPTVVNAEAAIAAELDPLTMLADLTKEEATSTAWYTNLKMIITAISIVIIAAVIIVGIRLRWWRRIRISRRQRLGLDMNEQALQEMNGIIRMFKKKGYIRHLHETMRESFARWNTQNRWLQKDLEQLLALLEKAKYSPYSVTGDDLILMMKTKRKLKEEL
jgi:transglutaminase-like putative cysteine protease